MPTQYPTTLDTATQQPSPGASTEMDDSGFEHDVLHTSHSGALLALEAKLGVGATTAAGASTNQVLVKQADGDTEWAAAPSSSTPTAITVADTTDTTCSVALFESATGDLAPKTDAGATYNAATGVLTATGFAGPLTGAVTGNASTATNSTTVTVADTSDTTCSVALFESATGSLGAKTDAGATYNAGTGTLTATAFAGPLTGNVTGNASGTAATVTGAAQSAITSVGTLTALTVNGVLTVTGAGNGLKIDGLSSSDANCLDDYEEGYWTCALSASTSGTITVNTGSDQGAYTKVGRVVHIQGLFTVSAISSPAGTLRVGGLPFTVAPSLNESADRGSNCGTVVNLANAKSGIITHVHANTTFMDMNAGGGGTAEDGVWADDVDTGSYFLISGSYIASA